jgi:hypothetical protein
LRWCYSLELARCLQLHFERERFAKFERMRSQGLPPPEILRPRKRITAEMRLRKPATENFMTNSLMEVNQSIKGLCFDGRETSNEKEVSKTKFPIVRKS